MKWWLIADTKLSNKCFNKWLVWNGLHTFQISAMIIILEITHPTGHGGGSSQSTLQAYWSWQLIGLPYFWEVSQSVKVLSEGNLNTMRVSYSAQGKGNQSVCSVICCALNTRAHRTFWTPPGERRILQLCPGTHWTTPPGACHLGCIPVGSQLGVSSPNWELPALDVAQQGCTSRAALHGAVHLVNLG